MNADDLFDADDAAILESLRQTYTLLDPVPESLVERVCFALTLETFDVDVMRVYEEVALSSAGVRGEDEIRTVTFDGDELTIVVTISPLDAAKVRLDGWLAPPAERPIEVRTVAGLIVARADALGRFLFDEVPRGVVQLVVRSVPGATARPVVTPSIVL